jgi:hypothetical protein
MENMESSSLSESRREPPWNPRSRNSLNGSNPGSGQTRKQFTEEQNSTRPGKSHDTLISSNRKSAPGFRTIRPTADGTQDLSLSQTDRTFFFKVGYAVVM